MRPSLLNRLFASVTVLPGIAEKSAKLYRKLTGRDDGARVVDLLFHLPSGAVDRRDQPKLRDVVPDSVVTLAVLPHAPELPGEVPLPQDAARAGVEAVQPAGDAQHDLETSVIVRL